jgi:hypothetical protein
VAAAGYSGGLLIACSTWFAVLLLAAKLAHIKTELLNSTRRNLITSFQEISRCVIICVQEKTVKNFEWVKQMISITPLQVCATVLALDYLRMFP